METSADDLSRAVETALRRVLSDAQLREEFWEHGYKHLSAHATNGASQWIGKRLLVSLIWAVVGAGIVWLIKLGALR